MSAVEILPDPRGVRDIALIEGRLPDRSDWERIISQDLWVNVLTMPRKAGDLAALLPWAGSIRFLMINSATCSDLSDLPQFRALEGLGIGGLVTVPPPPYRSETLADYTGPYRGFEVLLTSPRLRRLKLLLEPKETPKELSSQVRDLELATARSVSDLKVIGQLVHLERLTIHGSRRLSLLGIQESGIRSIHLEKCQQITEADALLSLASLESCWVEDCGDITPLEPLRALEADVRVVGRNPFHAAFRSAVGANWTFPKSSR